LKNQRVLVTGATGFLGRHLVQDLVSSGADVSILVRKTSNLQPFKNININIAVGDITDQQALLKATENTDIVYHLAGLIAYKKSDRAQMERVNVDGTGNIINACIANKVNKVLYLSSVAAIGASPTPDTIDEVFNFNLSEFNLSYFETKRKAEELVTKAVNASKLAVYMINPATIYGAGDATKDSRKTQIRVAQGKFKFYPPGGVNVVHVNDVIRAIHQCLENGQAGRRYIISGNNLTIKELFATIADIAGVPPPALPIPRWCLFGLGHFGDLLRACGKETSLSSETAITASYFHWFNNQRAIKELGFEPTPAKLAIEESVYWMRENGLLG